MTARTFTLVRAIDVTGISGLGAVAEGVEFSDGTVALRWLAPYIAATHRERGVRPTTVLHESVESVDALHGHNGATQVVWDDRDAPTLATEAAHAARCDAYEAGRGDALTVTAEQVEAHRPVKGGSSTSNIPGGFTGDWVICSCDPGGPWADRATLIPSAEFPEHLLAALGVTVAGGEGA